MAKKQRPGFRAAAGNGSEPLRANMTRASVREATAL